MTLSEELHWRGFVNQTTYKDPTTIDKGPIVFYWGVDPSADSMTVGHLAIAMMVRHFIEHGHKAILLVGGATGLIGDPDGKKSERELLSLEQVSHNKEKLARQYAVIFSGQPFEVVDNYDWFKDMGFLQFLRETGKHVPMRQMLGRDFVQSRLGEEGSGINYAEFSYSLIQGYDFLHLYKEKGVTLQVCGADQWGNSITGVDLIRRVEGKEAHVWSAPLVINKTTGVKFGKTEAGAVWLDPAKTTPTQFYQFWINTDDDSVEDYLKIYTMLQKDEVDAIMAQHREHPERRVVQIKLAEEVTRMVHGDQQLNLARQVTDVLVGRQSVKDLSAEAVGVFKQEQPHAVASEESSIITALTASGVASSNSEARKLIAGGGIYVNNKKVDRLEFRSGDYQNGRLLLRRGKAYKDSALIELDK